jgi:hypothetical protein
VSTELQLDLDPSIKREFGTLAGDARVRRTTAALEANGIRVLRAADAAEAKRMVLSLIPDGSQVHHGASESLELSASPRRSSRPDGTKPFALGSGIWIARRRQTRSAGCPQRLT